MLFKNTSEKIMSICASGRGFTVYNSLLLYKLKHKDSFGKSENLSKIFFAEILVFDHDYEGKLSSSNGLLWIFLFFYFFIIWIIFRIVRRASEQIYTRYQLYFAKMQGVIII